MSAPHWEVAASALKESSAAALGLCSKQPYMSVLDLVTCLWGVVELLACLCIYLRTAHTTSKCTYITIGLSASNLSCSSSALQILECQEQGARLSVVVPSRGVPVVMPIRCMHACVHANTQCWRPPVLIHVALTAGMWQKRCY
jgi:hypothetical protein